LVGEFLFLLETRPHLVATRCCKGCMSRSEEVSPLLKRDALRSVPLSSDHHDVTAAASLLAVTRLPFFAYAMTERANTSRRWCSHKVLSQNRVRCSQAFLRKAPLARYSHGLLKLVFANGRSCLLPVTSKCAVKRVPIKARLDRFCHRIQRTGCALLWPLVAEHRGQGACLLSCPIPSAFPKENQGDGQGHLQLSAT